jgi:hypothetical protein
MEASVEAKESPPGRTFSALILYPVVGKALLIFLGVLPALFLLADIHAFAGSRATIATMQRAWAMDYSRHTLYRLPGDQEFVGKKPAAETAKDIRF